jgi:prophage tail gpP-like protein
MGQELTLADACRFYAEHEGERVFTGVVDEYACVFDSKGGRLELSGRGMAALLLDNEALPAEYQTATAADIVADHVTPYGIEAVGGSKLRAVSGFVVQSGVSEWSVVQDFLCYYNGLVPRFDRQGRLMLDAPDDDMALVVDDNTPASALEYRQDRYGVLSQVVVRRRTAGNRQTVTDENFIAQGGQARRVVTVPNTTGTAAMRYTGDYQLKASQSGRVRCSLTAAGGFLAQPGQLVKVDRTGFGGNGTYRAAKVQVSCDENGLYTRLELGEKDSMI